MPIPAVSARRPVYATTAQSIAATARFGLLPTAREWSAGRAVTAAAARRTDPALATVLLCDRLRRHHQEAPVWLRIGGRAYLLLVHRDDVRAAVDGRPAGFTTPTPSSHGRNRSGDTIERPNRSWRHRFDTAARVAATDARTGRIAAAHTRTLLHAGDRITMAAWRTLHRRLLRHVLLGDSAAADDTLSSVAPDAVTGRVLGHLERAGDGRVPALLGDAPGTGALAAASLVRAMTGLADTLADNSFRTLQLLSVRPPACPGPMYATACLREAARLWPTAATLVRETTHDTRWGDTTVPGGTRLLVVNLFNHRDRRRLAVADEYTPGEWLYGGHALREPLFNGFGHRRAPDPVQDLALACGAVVLSTVTETTALLPTSGVLHTDGRVRHTPPPGPVVRLRRRGLTRPVRPALPETVAPQRSAIPATTG